MLSDNPSDTAKRAVLITGGAHRIGALFARHYAQAGWNVAISYHSSAQQAEQLVQQLRSRFGVVAAAIACDLAQAELARDLVQQAQQQVGRLHLLINNAAQFKNDVMLNNEEVSARPAALVTAERWQHHHNVNVLSPVLISQAFARSAVEYMQSLAAARRQEQAPPPPGTGISTREQANEQQDFDPCIINVVDQRVLRPNPMFFSYLAAKSSLHSVTTTMAQALAPYVRVNAIAPGMIYPSARQSRDNFDRQALGAPLRRFVDAQDIVRCADFFVASRSLTGQTVAIDCGQHMAWKTADVVVD